MKSMSLIKSFFPISIFNFFKKSDHLDYYKTLNLKASQLSNAD